MTDKEHKERTYFYPLRLSQHTAEQKCVPIPFINAVHPPFDNT